MSVYMPINLTNHLTLATSRRDCGHMPLRICAMIVGLLVSTEINIAIAQSVDNRPLTEPATVEDAKAEIERVNQAIAALEGMVISRSNKRTELQIALRGTDKAIAEANQSIDKSRRNIEALSRTINNLEAEAVILNRDIGARQSQLEKALGAFSILRQGGDLKILFGDSNAHETERHRAYFDILMSEQLAEIDAFKTAVSALDANQKAQEANRLDQEETRKHLESQRGELLAQRASQRGVIAELTALLERDGQQIETLKEDSSRLNTLLTELSRRLADLNLLGDFEDFSSKAGELNAPVKSLSKTRFGQKRDRGDLRWQGWIMPANRGTAVRAIHFGRVIYSDWLRGQGLLTIIDHGNGWMSLYGRNESLLKTTGDWVAPGEEIARVGSSGGATDPALYFEIRSDGVPVDPARWIRARR
jgi:septal ring factor EnvC (AmiA/AmiB activator)